MYIVDYHLISLALCLQGLPAHFLSRSCQGPRLTQCLGTHTNTHVYTHSRIYIYIYIHTYNPLSNSALGQPTNVQQQHLSCALTNSRTVLYIHRCCTYVHTHTHKHVRALKTHTTTHAHTNNEDPKKKEKKIPLILPQFGR